MSAILLLLAVVCFLLRAFGQAAFGSTELVPLGLAFFAGAGLVGPVVAWVRPRGGPMG